jgi:hypothetical protein
VVGHQAVSQEAHAGACAGLGEEFEEGGVVAVHEEDGAAGVAAVEGVLAVAALGSACGACHAAIMGGGGRLGNHNLPGGPG